MNSPDPAAALHAAIARLLVFALSAGVAIGGTVPTLKAFVDLRIGGVSLKDCKIVQPSSTRGWCRGSSS